ncbi:MAG TPA: hypothetical protein VGF22_05760 [Acidimicrobiales bacterium]
MPDKKLSTSDIIILAAGAVILIFGFLPFIKISGFDKSYNVFGDFAFPVATFVWLIGIIMAAHVALTKFANVNLPERVWEFTWDQVHVALALFAALIMVFWLITSQTGLEKGIGFFFLLLGAIALLVGAIMRTREAPAATAGPGTTPPTPF